MVVIRIYRIENEVNNLIYIGSTTLLLDTRMKIHIADAKRGYRTNLHNLMRELGYNNFHIMLIREIDCQDLDQGKFEEQEEMNRYDLRLLLNENDAVDANAHRREYKKRYYQENKLRLCLYQSRYNRQHYN
jgi:GIY-YIG catalytic domain